jgi:hypothetical protein
VADAGITILGVATAALPEIAPVTLPAAEVLVGVSETAGLVATSGVCIAPWLESDSAAQQSDAEDCAQSVMLEGITAGLVSEPAVQTLTDLWAWLVDQWQAHQGDVAAAMFGSIASCGSH